MADFPGSVAFPAFLPSPFDLRWTLGRTDGGRTVPDVTCASFSNSFVAARRNYNKAQLKLVGSDSNLNPTW